MKKNYVISEYGLIRPYKQDDNYFNNKSLKEIYMPNAHFVELKDFILENNSEGDDADKMFSIISKGKNTIIKIKNYVGVIETRNGITLEILPKIFFNNQNINFEDELLNTKKIFLKMLSRLKNFPFSSFSSAHLKTSENFPILEIFIESYVEEVKGILIKGIRSKYIQKEENLKFIKGKIISSLDVKYNIYNKSNIYCLYDEYSNDIIQNQLIKSTLLKLNRISKSHYNRKNIINLLSYFDSIRYSINFKSDFRKININNRLFSIYKKALKWSEIFLNNESFTNFSGNSKNFALLFPMERIFEDYIGYLMKTHSKNHKILTQDRSYSLINNHKKKENFWLKPDIIATDESIKEKIIIDTKWKLIDEYKSRGNYNISQSDMYQLYAYGKKYSTNTLLLKQPKLILLYPSNPNFRTPLEEFVYEDGLVLNVIPFDLASSLSFDQEKKEVLSILKNKEKDSYVL